jgi:sulfide:quinone oxidoreductase
MLTDDIAVAGQIGPEDIAAVRQAGFKSLVCNRPDGEAPGQPPFAAVEAAARELGLDARYMPIGHSPLDAGAADGFAAMVAELPKPVLAYCRSGTRSAKLVMLWQARAEGDV